MVVYGMMLKGWTVAIEKGKTYYCVVIDGPGSYESCGGFKTYEAAKEYFKKKVEEIRMS